MDTAKLHELLSYDPETGIFRWRVKRKQMNPGDRAGYVNSRGYRYLRIDNVIYKANRVAWLYAHGEWPKGQVDHINRDRLDDRLANLRDVTGNVNQQNRGVNKNNKTGLLGVSPDPTGKWRAQITVNSKVIYLGLFPTPEDAHQAYLAAKAIHHK